MLGDVLALRGANGPAAPGAKGPGILGGRPGIVAAQAGGVGEGLGPDDERQLREDLLAGLQVPGCHPVPAHLLVLQDLVAFLLLLCVSACAKRLLLVDARVIIVASAVSMLREGFVQIRPSERRNWDRRNKVCRSYKI